MVATRAVVGFALGLALWTAPAPVAHAQAGKGRQEPAADPDEIPTPAAAPARAGNILGPEGANVVVIALAPAVQEELKLTEAQKTGVFQLAQAANQRAGDLFRASMMAGRNDPQGMMAAFARQRDENEKSVGKLLSKKQNERLRQLVLRVEGPLGVSRPEVASQLKLGTKQTQQVQAAVQQWSLSQRQFLQATRQAAVAGAVDRGRDAQLRKFSAGQRAAATKEIGKVLNGKQRLAFNEMLGEPFELARIDPSLKEADPADAPAPAREKTRKGQDRKKAAAPREEPPAAEKEPGGSRPAADI